MRVEKFEDQYQPAAEAYGVTVHQLRQRDSSRIDSLHRWLAFEGDGVAGVVTGRIRSDDRLFLRFGCPDSDAYRILSQAVVDDLNRPVYVSVDSRQSEDYRALIDAGYEVEVTTEVFDVPFQPVLRWLAKVSVPSGFRVVSAAGVPFGALFDLDNRLRRLIPGTDGWVGDIQSMKSELATSPPFDAQTYLVGLAPDGSMAGLVRIWRNETGPRLGMVGTLPTYRTTLIGPAMIHIALEAANSWGSNSFVTETSIGNRHVHPRLERLGAQSLGFIHQMVFR